MINLKEMSIHELVTLKANLNNELEKRQRLAYNKALEKFSDALDVLSSNFPYEHCFTDSSETWEDLRENYSWNF